MPFYLTILPCHPCVPLDKQLLLIIMFSFSEACKGSVEMFPLALVCQWCTPTHLSIVQVTVCCSPFFIYNVILFIQRPANGPWKCFHIHWPVNSSRFLPVNSAGNLFMFYFRDLQTVHGNVSICLNMHWSVNSTVRSTLSTVQAIISCLPTETCMVSVEMFPHTLACHKCSLS